ncbi:HAD-IA family hydrolase [Psychrosphaera aquimarina]|uniref:phosphoglycolate phosphatase n=1 Tax=Psychrosphaera aquimarina TaxID=2044854 RepID=A0ABU3QZ37_9GAMM|nr:HAD-IA family hydrolase [Psychrosphaera aquimarina]MDU0112482.1 HAD-IA family hydrolase [Psychrosphaera aquimarina]
MLTNKLSAVIFDLDDTLVSSSLDFTKIKKSLGCPLDVDLLDFVNAKPKAQRDVIEPQLIGYEISEAMDSVKLDGADDLLALLHQLKLPMAIVTRNCREAALIKMENNNLNIPIVISREEHKAKPAPDALLFLAEQWQIKPENILYVGDFLYDIQAAINANTMSCLVTHGKSLDYADLATLVVNELTDLCQIIENTM